MAQFRCLHHRPTQPHYGSYARPPAYLELACTEKDCTHRVVVWLNPEEVKDYERGARLFYDADYSTVKVESSGLSAAGPAPMRLPRPTLRPLFRVFRSFGRLKGSGRV